MNDVHRKRQRYLKRIQAHIARMPSLSTTVIKVLETCNDPNSSANDLKRVISLDPVLTGRVLRLINSAYYSIRLPVTSLTRAIIMLGLNNVKNLALSFSILETVSARSSCRAFSTDDFWTHCLGVGVAAKSLATLKGIPLPAREEYFVAGLLHDLGKLPLNKQFPADYHKVWETAIRDEEPLHYTEEAFLGFDHCTVGSMIAQKWRLAMPLIETLTHHHSPADSSEENRNFVFIVSLANQFANHLNIGTAGDQFTDQSLIAYLIGEVEVDWTTLYDFRETVFGEIEKAKVFLEIAQKG